MLPSCAHDWGVMLRRLYHWRSELLFSEPRSSVFVTFHMKAQAFVASSLNALSLSRAVMSTDTVNKPLLFHHHHHWHDSPL
jgi:hypothetical protein